MPDASLQAAWRRREIGARSVAGAGKRSRGLGQARRGQSRSARHQLGRGPLGVEERSARRNVEGTAGEPESSEDRRGAGGVRARLGLRGLRPLGAAAADLRREAILVEPRLRQRERLVADDGALPPENQGRADHGARPGVGHQEGRDELIMTKHAFWACCALAIAAGAAAQTAQKTYDIKATPETTFYRFLDADAKPVLTINSGDIVKLETATGTPGYFERLGVPKDRIPAELSVTFKGADNDGGRRDHTLTGILSFGT